MSTPRPPVILAHGPISPGNDALRVAREIGDGFLDAVDRAAAVAHQRIDVAQALVGEARQPGGDLAQPRVQRVGDLLEGFQRVARLLGQAFGRRPSRAANRPWRGCRRPAPKPGSAGRRVRWRRRRSCRCRRHARRFRGDLGDVLDDLVGVLRRVLDVGDGFAHRVRIDAGDNLVDLGQASGARRRRTR